MHEHFHARSTVSGLVIVAPKQSATDSNSKCNNEAVLKKIEELGKKLQGRVKVVSDDAEGLRESERWLIEKAY